MNFNQVSVDHMLPKIDFVVIGVGNRNCFRLMNIRKLAPVFDAVCLQP